MVLSKGAIGDSCSSETEEELKKLEAENKKQKRRMDREKILHRK